MIWKASTMKKRSIIAMLAAAAVLALTFAAAPAGAQDTTAVYVVHGLNLSGQTQQGDGGTDVTVCAAGKSLIADFEFGQIVGPVDLPSGESVAIDVYEGADVDCANPGAANLLIDTDVTPEGAAVALVATSASGTLGLTAFGLNAECAEDGNGRLTALHASGDTGEVDVLVADSSAGMLTFGESLDADVPADTYSVEVTLDSDPFVGPADVPVAAQTNQLVFVVGNITGEGSTEAVALLGDFPVDTCETTTTTAPVPTTAAVPPTTSAPAAAGGAAAAPLAISG